MKKIWIKILAILGAIAGILFFFLGFKRKPKKPKEIDDNQIKINIIKSVIDQQKVQRDLAKQDLEELKEVVDGRSKEVRKAKEEVTKVDDTIKELEQQLRDAGVDI